ncbi:hypothetical protein J4E93_010551 [Alternaria ventricosa]|uniref:uncharacterized protein n=1 Tax=Alternaria ventricosa TaxID=1187951 RepID=UPI0020C29216|nr:uncharacterized protein J4E93_010551 [Alternaria ventricosa]KAI4637151.1 hypothetical protein J4E93_010551 [Alternaria ventricosa]
MPSTKRPAPRSASPQTPPPKRMRTSDSVQKATRSNISAVEPGVIDVMNRALDYTNAATKYWKIAAKEANAEIDHWKKECERWSDRASRSDAAVVDEKRERIAAQNAQQDAERRCAQMLAKLATHRDALLQIGGLSKRTTDGPSTLSVLEEKERWESEHSEDEGNHDGSEVSGDEGYHGIFADESDLDDLEWAGITREMRSLGQTVGC